MDWVSRDSTNSKKVYHTGLAHLQDFLIVDYDSKDKNKNNNKKKYTILRPLSNDKKTINVYHSVQITQEMFTKLIAGLFELDNKEKRNTLTQNLWREYLSNNPHMPVKDVLNDITR